MIPCQNMKPTEQDILTLDCSQHTPQASWFKTALGIITSCCSQMTAYWRPTY